MSEIEHTPGPWNFTQDEHCPECFEVKDRLGFYVATCHDGVRSEENAKENARRIVACVNACEGISTENLEESRPVKWLAEQYGATIKQRDELLEALRMYALPIDTANIALSCIEYGSEAVERELKRRIAVAKATGEQA